MIDALSTDAQTRHAARAWLAGGLVLASLGLATRFALANAYSLYDDAYIYFTYAENLAHGCGLDFRCDRAEPVEGFTSPLYMLCLALMRTFTTDLESSATCVGVLALSLSIAMAAHAATRFVHSALAWIVALAVVAALGLDDFALLNAVTGMETALFTAVATGAFHAALYERPTLSWWLALAVWARPEGVLLFALANESDRRFWRVPLAAAALLLALRFWYYGELLPNTYYAKSGGTAVHAALGRDYVMELLRDCAPVLLAPLALLDLRTRRVSAGLLLAACVLLAFFLRSGGDVFGHGRLFVPFVPALYACSALGLLASARRLAGSARLWAVAPLLAWALFAASAHRIAPSHGFANVLRWETLGKFLGREHAGARIATVPIGAISYFSGSPVIDMVGLTEREVAKAGRTVPPELLKPNWIGHERHNSEHVLAQHPQLIVFGTKFSKQPLAAVQDLRAGFYAEWLLLQQAKQGQIPYSLYTPQVAPGVYWHMLRANAY